MTLNKKVINYKVLDLVILYNFDIKFDSIRDYMKSYEFFSVEPFLGASMSSPALKNVFLKMGDTIIRPRNGRVKS
jgi:hypothetical protein